MGYPSSKSIQTAILSAVSVELLAYERENEFGRVYRAYIELQGPSGLVRRIRTVWIIRFEEDIARFVTAVPDRLGGL